MKDEVEDFLRRVAQMRAQAEAQAKAQQQRPAQRSQQLEQQPSQREQQPAKPQPPPPQARQPQPPRPVPKRPEPKRPQLEPVEAEIVTSELRQRDEVSRHVAQHLRGREEIAKRTERLGDEVELADDKLEAHLHQVFDHQLGQLTTSGDGAAAPQSQSAHDLSAPEILRLLRSPQSVRDALIMSEVFRRPEW